MDVYYLPLLWVCSIVFLTSAPLALALRARRPQRMSWWLVVVFAAALGWIASHIYACLETKHIEALRDELFRQGTIADFSMFAPPSFTLYWGWTFGLEYLVACLGLYRFFRETMNVGPFRPFVALLTVLLALAAFSALPPWTNFELPLPFEFAALYASFLFCAGLSHHVLRFFRLEAACYPFVVMFVINLLLRLMPWVLTEIGALVGPDLPLQIPEPAEWAALFGSLFTAFWWIAIPKSQSNEFNSV